MVRIFLSALLLISMTDFLNAQAPVVTSQKIVLTQRRAAELALQNGTRAKETIYKYDGLEADKADFNLPLYLSNYDWKTTLESGYELDKLETFTVTNTKFQRYRSQLSLDKSFLTGTKVTSSYLRLSQKAEYPIGSENFSKAPIEQTQDLFSLTIEQNIFRNAFGRGDRAGLRAIEYASDSNQISKVSELQVVVLDAIRAFWRAYVAQENFKESVAARDRYQKLVDTIKRKNAVGYARPGEYAQVQAELETRIQNTKNSSLVYLSELDNLVTVLNTDPGSEFELRISDELMAPPQLKVVEVENTRTVRAQKLNVQSSEEKLTSVKSKTGLGVSLVGKLSSSGVDLNANSSFSEMTGGSQPFYYAGVKLQYSFGSGNLEDQVKNKNMILLLDQSKLERLRSEQGNSLRQSERKVQTTYAVAQSFLKEREFRDRAVRELTTTYNQGRTDINTYIEALNKLFVTKTNYLDAVGEYQVALNEWAAARDELIPDPNKTKNEEKAL